MNQNNKKLTSVGLAVNHEQEQTGALAAFGRDVWKGVDADVVPSLANILSRMRRVVRVQWWRGMGRMPLLV